MRSVLWEPAITACIGHMGFRNTLRLTGALGATLICVSASALSWEPTMAADLHVENDTISRVRGLFVIPFPAWKMAKRRTFIAQALGAALQSAAYYTPVFFTVSYAKSLGYSDEEGANLTAVSNACNAIGKIAVGFIADRIGRLNSFFLTTLLSATATLTLWVSSTVVGMDSEPIGKGLFASFTVLYGLFASAYISLFLPILVELFGMRELPRVTGFMYMMQGMAAMLGTPVAGALTRGHGDAKTPEDYLGMSILVGGLMFLATGAVAWVRVEANLGCTGGQWN